MSPDRLTRRDFLALGVATAATAFTEPYELLRYQKHPNIIFAGQQNKGDKYDVFLFNPTTGNLTNLTNTKDANELNPAVSKNGTEIMLYSDQRNGNNDIYALSLKDISHPRLALIATDLHEYDPASGKGNIFAYKEDPNKDGDRGDIIVVINGVRINLTGAFGKEEDYKPEFSHDGSKIYFTRRQTQGNPHSDQIYVINADGSGQPKLLANGWYPAVNPISGSVAFVYKDRIFVMNADGDNTHILPGQPPEGDNNDPAWSPDGKQIIFINNATGTYKVHTINADGSGGKQIDVLGITGNMLSPIFAN